MKNRKMSGPGRFFKFLSFGIIAVLIFGGIVMLLWNAVLPAILHVSAINFWQALGILVLSKILFGSFRQGCGPLHHFGPPRHLRERFMNMTDEEKAQFKENFKRRCYPGEA